MNDFVDKIGMYGVMESPHHICACVELDLCIWQAISQGIIHRLSNACEYIILLPDTLQLVSHEIYIDVCVSHDGRHCLYVLALQVLCLINNHQTLSVQ